MISKDRLLDLVRQAGDKDYTVFAPVETDAGVMLRRIDDSASIDFDHVLTVNTLKDVGLPQVEPLAEFDRERRELKTIRDEEETVLVFGSRPCDAAAQAILDAILIGEVTDARYAARRNRMVMMTLGCSKADGACFCTSMGYGPHDPTGSDVLLLPRCEEFVVRPITPKGEEFLRELGITADGDVEPDPPPELERKVDITGLKEKLDRNFDDPIWKSVSENCVSCGTCFYMCPTCHCFDVIDEAGLSRGRRQRLWDTCSFAGFTKMASHQPRVGRHARYRQRIMHKFKYTVDNLNLVACVGDGRCIRACPYGVDICEILESLVANE